MLQNKEVSITLIDYAYKSEVMRDKLHLLQKQVSKAYYADYKLHDTGEVIDNVWTLEQAQMVDMWQWENNQKAWKEAIKINNAHSQRVKRLRRKIENMLEEPCIFLTFTFNDKTLQTTNEDTRRQKVRRYLSAYNTEYVANIDFGRKNEREHYHAIIKANKVDFGDYDYGIINGERIRKTSDGVKLAKYIAKLTNHAIKDTAKGSRIIYNR